MGYRFAFAKPNPGQIKKPSSLKTGTKAYNFCGTTQIDDKSSTHIVYYHIQPTGNGQGSRKRLLSFDFRLPSQVHSEWSLQPHSHHWRLSECKYSILLFLLKGLLYWTKW